MRSIVINTEDFIQSMGNDLNLNSDFLVFSSLINYYYTINRVKRITGIKMLVYSDIIRICQGKCILFGITNWSDYTSISFLQIRTTEVRGIDLAYNDGLGTELLNGKSLREYYEYDEFYD